MTNSNSKDNMSMSTQELIKELKEAEKVLFDLRFKKATRQPFKPHQIKATILYYTITIISICYYITILIYYYYYYYHYRLYTMYYILCTMHYILYTI